MRGAMSRQAWQPKAPVPALFTVAAFATMSRRVHATKAFFMDC